MREASAETFGTSRSRIVGLSVEWPLESTEHDAGKGKERERKKERD